ncbi:MAG: EAL domain-containing protein [Elusimicrobiota bacterium]
MHLLYFRLLGAERFESIHGNEFSAVARADLTRRFAALSRVLLRQHEILSDARSPAFGVWMTPFKVRRLEIEAGEAEQLESVVSAGREMGRAVLEEELGSATALHARLDVGTLLVDGSNDDPAAWTARLAALPRDAAPPPARIPFDDRKALLAIITRRVDIRLQAIVALRTGETAAYEALARGPEDGPWFEADRLFEAAARCGLRPDLELACFDSAVELIRRLPEPYRLAVNLSPDLFGESAVQRLPDVPDLPRRLILEVTEHLPIPAPERLNEEIRFLRDRGAKLALDDAGCGYLNMDLVRALKPDIVKLCITVTRRIDGGPDVLALVRKTVEAIRGEGAEVLAEGVENGVQARLARECGCSLAQGFYFDKPRKASEVLKDLSARADPRPLDARRSPRNEPSVA